MQVNRKAVVSSRRGKSKRVLYHDAEIMEGRKKFIMVKFEGQTIKLDWTETVNQYEVEFLGTHFYCDYKVDHEFRTKEKKEVITESPVIRVRKSKSGKPKRN